MPTAVAADPIEEAIARMGGIGEACVPADQPVTAEYLHELNIKHENLAFQAASETEIIIAGPPGGPAPRSEHRVIRQVDHWGLVLAGGDAIASARGFDPPDGLPWIPDGSWLSDETLAEWERLGRPGYSSGFWQITPDFILEVRSPGQSVASQKRKMDGWAAAGVKLGLLIDPESKTAWLYRPDGSVAEHRQPATLSMEPEMPGLTLDFTDIWAFPWV